MRKEDKFGTNTRKAKVIINPIGPISKGEKCFQNGNSSVWHFINFTFISTTAR